MPVRKGRLYAGVGCRHPVIVCEASLVAESIRQMRPLGNQTGAQYSAVESTRAKVAVPCQGQQAAS